MTFNDDTRPAPAEEPEPAAEQPKPEKVTVRVELPVETNEQLKSLAKLWGETKTETAWKLLSGAINHHYSINKLSGRL